MSYTRWKFSSRMLINIFLFIGRLFFIRRRWLLKLKRKWYNPGTLPISAYGRRTLGNNPLMSLDEMRHNVIWEEDALVVGDEVEGEEEEDSSINENFDEGSSGDTNEAESDLVFIKDFVVLISQDDRLSGPFLLGRLTKTGKEDQRRWPKHKCMPQRAKTVSFSSTSLLVLLVETRFWNK